MAYTKQTWVDTAAGGTPVSASRLNHMEDGIFDASTEAEAATADAATALSTANTAQSTATSASNAAAALSAAFQPSTFTGKGQIIVGTGNGTATTVPVVSDGRFLEADASTGSGVKWGRKFTSSPTAPPSPSVGDLWLKTS